MLSVLKISILLFFCLMFFSCAQNEPIEGFFTKCNELVFQIKQNEFKNQLVVYSSDKKILKSLTLPQGQLVLECKDDYLELNYFQAPNGQAFLRDGVYKVGNGNFEVKVNNYYADFSGYGRIELIVDSFSFDEENIYFYGDENLLTSCPMKAFCFNTNESYFQKIDNFVKLNSSVIIFSSAEVSSKFVAQRNLKLFDE